MARSVRGEAKPFLKWAGGKTQLLADIEATLPKSLYDWDSFTYVEPFVGSGAVLFWMLRKFPNLKRAVINDINPDLTEAYRVIKHQPHELVEALKKIQTQYYALGHEEERKFFFLEQRDIYNTRQLGDVEHTALLIFLNRTCFNGLYRVNSKGLFNVPFGRYNNPTICDEETILADSAALQKVDILTGDFEQTINESEGNAFFYFDPPYKPLSNTSSFNAYAKDGFNDSEQERLKEFCEKLSANNCLFLLSNSDLASHTIQDLYFDNLYSGFTIRRVKARRSINASGDKRGVLSELLITNYQAVV